MNNKKLKKTRIEFVHCNHSEPFGHEKNNNNNNWTTKIVLGLFNLAIDYVFFG